MSYVDFNLKLTPAVSKSDSLSKLKRIQFLKHTGELIVERLFVNGVCPEIFESAKNMVESTVAIITDQGDILKILQDLNAYSDFLYIHSLGTSLYSVMIAQKINWTTPANIFKISIGGIVHDIGKRELNRHLLEKPKKELSTEENRLLQSHPARGYEFLKNVPSIPEDVLNIVLQHHEDCQGLGYPHGLSKHRIHPMARLISVADEFCNFVLHNPNNPNAMEPHQAIDQILKLKGDRLDPSFFATLMRLFDYPVPDEYERIQVPA